MAAAAVRARLRGRRRPRALLFVGDCMNLALISLFAHFYWRSYLRAAPNPVTKRE